ncbi:MAG: hypothetical protein K2Q14_02490 [Gammaproteobacteria bacterium]|nr:hypothetical protein [Gammaproteobacteria bacterium]
MKNTLTKMTVGLLCVSLTAGQAFAFVPKAALAGHAMRGQGHMAQGIQNHHPFNQTQRAVGGRFSNSPTRNFQQPARAVNPNVQSFSQANGGIHHYNTQTMSVNQGRTVVNQNVNYHSSTTIRHTNTVNTVNRGNTVLGPHATQPIEVNHLGSPVVVNRGHSPVIVNHNSPVVINNYRGGGYGAVVVRQPVVIAPYHWNSYGGYYNNYNNVNTFLAVALGVSLFANVVQATSNHNTNTVVYPTYYPYPSNTMSVYAPVPYAPTTFVPYTANSSNGSGNSGTSTKSSQPVNVTINNTVNTTTAAPAQTTTTDSSSAGTTTTSSPVATDSSAAGAAASSPTTTSTDSSTGTTQ